MKLAVMRQIPHTNPLSRFFYYDRDLGHTTTPQTWDGANPLQTSLHYFCPGCGQVWAKIILENGPHAVVNRPCRKCYIPWGNDYAGSFLHPWHPTHHLELSQKALHHEFFTLLLKAL